MWYDLYPKYVLDYLMQAEITNYTNNEIELKLKDEDISIMKHPLIKEYLMRINSQVNPMDVLEKSVKSADEFLKDLSHLIESSQQKVV